MNSVFGLDRKIWTVILVLSHYISNGLMIAAICTDYWFHQKLTFYGSTDKFKGGLFGPKTYNGRCDTYLKCYEDYCDHCTNMGIWAASGIVYGTLESLAIVLSLITTVFLLFSLSGTRLCRKRASISGTTWLVIATFILHSLAFIIWAIMVKLTVDDCTHDMDYSGSKSVCVEGGAILSMIILVGFFFLAVFHFILARKVADQEREQIAELLTHN